MPPFMKLVYDVGSVGWYSLAAQTQARAFLCRRINQVSGYVFVLSNRYKFCTRTLLSLRTFLLHMLASMETIRAVVIALFMCSSMFVFCIDSCSLKGQSHCHYLCNGQYFLYPSYTSVCFLLVVVSIVL